MRALKDFEIFIRTTETGSLSAAARSMDLTPAAASAAIKRLETELNTVLFVRSTRSLRLTLEGEFFLRHSQQATQLLYDAQAALATGRSVVQGVLQLSVPSDFGRNVLLDWLNTFQTQHPKLHLRLQLSDRIADIYRQPVDITLRYGKPPDSSLVALSLAPGNHRVLCASPAYLDRFGTPTTPEALSDHNCLCYMLNERTYDHWRFSHKDDEISVPVSGDRMSDDGDVVRRWAMEGYGIAYKSLLDVAEDLRQGRLVRLCKEWETEQVPLNLICADRRQLNPTVEQLRQYLQARCAQHLIL